MAHSFSAWELLAAIMQRCVFACRLTFEAEYLRSPFQRAVLKRFAGSYQPLVGFYN